MGVRRLCIYMGVEVSMWGQGIGGAPLRIVAGVDRSPSCSTYYVIYIVVVHILPSSYILWYVPSTLCTGSTHSNPTDRQSAREKDGERSRCKQACATAGLAFAALQASVRSGTS